MTTSLRMRSVTSIVVLGLLVCIYAGAPRPALGQNRTDGASQRAPAATLDDHIARLADLYGRGLYNDARTEGEAALALSESRGRSQDADTALILNYLGLIATEQRRYTDGEAAFAKALAIYAAMPRAVPQDVATTYYNLGLLHAANRRWPEAQAAFQRTLTLREGLPDPDQAEIGVVLNDLGLAHQALGDWKLAEQQLLRSLRLLDAAKGPMSEEVTHPLNSLGLLYREQGRFGEAERMFRRYLQIAEAVLGSEHRDVANALNNIAHLYYDQERHADAEGYFRRALAISEKAVDRDPLGITSHLNNLAETLRQQDKLDEAEPLYQRALAIRERVLGPRHVDLTPMLNNLALIAEERQQLDRADPLFARALAIREEHLGPAHRSTAEVLNNLALLRIRQDRTDEARLIYERLLTIARSPQFERDHPFLGTVLSNLGALHVQQGNWQEATRAYSESVQLVVRRSQRSGDIVGQGPTGDGKSEADLNRFRFVTLARVGRRLAEADRTRTDALAAELFEVAQWGSGSSTAGAIAQMATRLVAGRDGLDALVRERQDRRSEWQEIDRQLRATRIGGADASSEITRLIASQQQAEARIGAIDYILRRQFPDYAELANPAPLTIAETQAALRDDEVLALIVGASAWKSLPNEVLVWLVTKHGAPRWVHTVLGPEPLAESVGALRCGLDDSSWEGSGQARCARWLGVNLSPTEIANGQPLPFDLRRAHALYKALFGEAEALLRNADGSRKELLVIDSGALGSLPLQVLVVEPPAVGVAATSADLAGVKWFGIQQPITVLPSVASLQALRRNARTRAAPDAYIGFGNPLLTGRKGTDRRAWQHQSCASAPAETSRHAASVPRSAAPPARRDEPGTDVEDLRRQPPLPETAAEICAVARVASGAASDAIVNLGERATETRVRALSADGTLARARVVHFATHGLVPDETAAFGRRAEAALMLTPPERASEADDGLLTASEVATLKLNADWVILSACNTATGEDNGETLSGLARAFFYAGTRALLVSHWYVDSRATVALVTGVFESLRHEPGISRADALRRSMATLAARGDALAHPSAWAPFVVVGEGAAK